MVALKDIVPAAQNNINTKFILLDKGSPQLKARTRHAWRSWPMTATVHFQLWGEECDAFEPSDIIQLYNGIFSYNNKNALVLRAGKRGRVEKVGEFTMVFVETPNLSEIRWVPDANNSKRFVQEAVISPHSRIFPPNY